MRGGQSPHATVEENEESVFVSMTDMTISILFILLILLAFFASQLRPERDDPAQLLIEKQEQIAELTQALESAEDELETLRHEIAMLDQDSSDVLHARLALSEARLMIEVLTQQIEDVRARTIDRLQVYNAEVAEVRRRLLTILQRRIDADFPELKVRLSPSADALQFVGEGLFAKGSYSPSIPSRTKIERIAEIVDEALSCYTLGVRSDFDKVCNPALAVVEALQIEGHTDSDGVRRDNVVLGARRAAATYGAMIAHRPGLIDHQNLARQPVLSVAGYGEDRPVAGNETDIDKSLNRRIDLRFIMLRPASVEDIEAIEEALRTGSVR